VVLAALLAIAVAGIRSFEDPPSAPTASLSSRDVDRVARRVERLRGLRFTKPIRPLFLDRDQAVELLERAGRREYPLREQLIDEETAKLLGLLEPSDSVSNVLKRVPSHARAYKSLAETLLASGRIDAWFANFERFERHCPNHLALAVHALEVCAYRADFVRLERYIDGLRAGRFTDGAPDEMQDALEQLLYLLHFFDVEPALIGRYARTHDALARRMHGEPRPKRARPQRSSTSSPMWPNGGCPRSCPRPIASVRSSLSRSARATVREICVVSSVCVRRVR